MNTRDVLSLIMKYGSVSPFEWLKIFATENEIHLSSIDDGRNTLFTGVLKVSAEELKGEFAIANFKLLDSLLNHPSFSNDEKSSYEISRDEKNSNPLSITFKNHEGSEAVYAFFPASMMPKIPTLKRTDCDFYFNVSKSKVDEFKSFANLYSFISKDFSVDILDEKVYFVISSYTYRDKVKMMFSPSFRGRNIVREIQGIVWPTTTLINILKLSVSEDNNLVEIGVMKEGAMKITNRSDLYNLEYVIMGKSQ